ncbi:MAG: NAD(P)/FAD-dependent oxidoreductase [Chloroflexota bacterium]|nr:NAD(P)/FAD-dependent oxidoreductase [Chloroflexota bacterium]
MAHERLKVVIIGAGFGGLYAAQTLERQADIDVLLIDKNNYHTFTPLLYQVATCGLDADAIAYPIRGIFRRQSNVDFLLGSVTAIDTTAQRVTVQASGEERIESYDRLIIAAGSVTNYFGNSAIGKFAFELKSLEDALRLRSHILSIFERAAWSADDAARYAYTTIVVVGGGPTGLETAGAMQELYSFVLKKEYTGLTPRVILVEAVDRLLVAYPERLQAAAKRQLESLGVEVILGDAVEKAFDDHIILKSGRVIPTHTLVWSAGVQAAPAAELIATEVGKAGRLMVEPTMAVKNVENVYAVGDIVYLLNDKGVPYAAQIPVAKQQGELAARNLLRKRMMQAELPFVYRDRGIMATIGRSRAVAWLYYRIQLTGFAAWLAWLALHLVSLLGMRNRLNVLLNWVWNYFTFDRSARIILPLKQKSTPSLPENNVESSALPPSGVERDLAGVR